MLAIVCSQVASFPCQKIKYIAELWIVLCKYLGEVKVFDKLIAYETLA